MKKTIIILLLATGFIMTANGQEHNEVVAKLQKLFESVEGDFALAFHDFETGEEILINEKKEFHAASTMKTPVMMEVFRQAEMGVFDLQDSVIVKNEFKSIIDSSLYSMDISEDGGESLYEYLDKKRTIYQLTELMITVSSNLATNILIDMVTADSVMKTMKRIGANDIQVLRGVEDLKAYRLGKNNTTTALDLMLIFKAIENNEILSDTSCHEMIEILKRQHFNTVIPAKLPKDVVVAHKTGSITGINHDSGIVYLPDGKKYVLVILGKNIADDAVGHETEAIASKILYDYITNK